MTREHAVSNDNNHGSPVHSWFCASVGRSGEQASVGLTESLVDLGFEADRLKTGTPARVDQRTIDFSNLEAQPGEDEVSCGDSTHLLYMSFTPTI